MMDFEFHNPVKIVFGRGRESEIGSVLQGAGLSRVLLLYGRKSADRNGLLGRVRESLKSSGVDWVEHGGVQSNPVLSHARAGVEIARGRAVQAVLAVGGGSVLDEGKGIAVGALSSSDLWNHYCGAPVTGALPVYAILTLAATGSEMNGNSVLTNDETRHKFHFWSPFVYPKVSILNPALTCSVPPNYSVYSAVDALAHVIEAYFTKTGKTQLQNRLVESLVLTVMDTTGRILRNPDDYEARAEFMWTATLALNGLTTAGIGSYQFPNHMIEHALSALYDVPHGAGLAVVIPAWMKWFWTRNVPQFVRFAEQIFHLPTAEKGIEALENWMLSIGAPVRLGQLGIPAGDIDRIVRNVGEGVRDDPGGDTPLSADAVREILQLAAR